MSASDEPLFAPRLTWRPRDTFLIDVDYAARQVVVAARCLDVVGGVLASQTYHRLGVGPPGSGLYDGIVRKLQRDALTGIGGRHDRFGNNVCAVGKIYRAIRVVVDYFLYRIAYVARAVGGQIIGYHDVPLFGRYVLGESRKNGGNGNNGD